MILLPQPLKCCALTDVSHRSWYLVLFNFLAICVFSQWDVCSYFLFIYLLTFANFCSLFWRIGTSCVIQAGLELSMCPRLEFTILCVRFKNAMSFLLSWAQPPALLFSSQGALWFLALGNPGLFPRELDAMQVYLITIPQRDFPNFSLTPASALQHLHNTLHYLSICFLLLLLPIFSSTRSLKQAYCSISRAQLALGK